MEKEFDLLIIGAGIVGLMTATLALIRKPTMKIAVVDKNILGSGATRYSAAFSTPLSKSAISCDLITRGAKVLQEIQHHLPIKLIKMPCLYVVDHTCVDQLFEHYMADDLLSCERNVLEDSSYKNWIIPENKRIFISQKSAHHVNIAALVEALAKFLRKNKCSIYESCAIHKIEENAGQLMASGANNICFRSKKMITAIGPWQNQSLFFPQIMPNKICDVKKVAALHFNMIPHEGDPAIVFFDEGAFVLPIHEKNYCLLSFTSEDWGVSPESNLSISARDIEISKSICDLYAIDFNKLYLGGRVFCDAYSANKEFSINPLGNHMMVVTGASGSGYRFSYGLADTLLENI